MFKLSSLSIVKKIVSFKRKNFKSLREVKKDAEKLFGQLLIIEFLVLAAKTTVYISKSVISVMSVAGGINVLYIFSYFAANLVTPILKHFDNLRRAGISIDDFFTRSSGLILGNKYAGLLFLVSVLTFFCWRYIVYSEKFGKKETQTQTQTQTATVAEV